MPNSSTTELIAAARAARHHARASFTNYRVGAAVKTKSGEIVRGCNVEVVIVGLSKCAEQVALFAAIAAGHSEFTELAVATKNGGAPCGACRQMIWELCGDIPVHTVDDDGHVKTYTSREIFPYAFDDSKL